MFTIKKLSNGNDWINFEVMDNDRCISECTIDMEDPDTAKLRVEFMWLGKITFEDDGFVETEYCASSFDGIDFYDFWKLESDPDLSDLNWDKEGENLSFKDVPDEIYDEAREILDYIADYFSADLEGHDVKNYDDFEKRNRIREEDAENDFRRIEKDEDDHF